MRRFLVATAALLLATAPAYGARAGDVDTAFGTNGRVVLTFGGNEAKVGAAALLPDGAITVAAGASHDRDDEDFTVFRLRGTGGLDTAFGHGGFAVVDVVDKTVETAWVHRYDFADGLWPLPGGRLLVWGTSYGSTDDHVTFGDPERVVVRLLPDGTLDPAFGVAGMLVAPVDAGVLVLADGRIARYDRGEGWFETYSADGAYLARVPAGVYDRVARAPDGRVYFLATRTLAGGATALTLTRLRADLNVDAAYGGDPGVRAGRGGVFEVLDWLVAPDGTVLLYLGPDAGPPTLVRVTAAGHVDPAFGDHGYARLRGGGRLAVDGSRRVLLSAGTYDTRTPSRFTLTRLRADGRPDPAFGDAGVATATMTAHTSPAEVLPALVQGSRLVVPGMVDIGGTMHYYRGTKAGLVAFRATGSPAPATPRPPVTPTVTPAPRPTASDSVSPTAPVTVPATPPSAPAATSSHAIAVLVGTAIVVLGAAVGGAVWLRLRR